MPAWRAVRADLGLDQPFPIQFARFIGNAVQGEFGLSLRQGRKVSPEALRLLRAILGGGLASVLAEEPSPAIAEVGAIATEAVEHHLERRLRVPGLLDQHRL